MQRAVGIPDLRHSVRIPKFRVAFLTGHQIKLFHLCIRPFVFRAPDTQRYHCIMNSRFLPLTLMLKRSTDFQRECVLTMLQMVSAGKGRLHLSMQRHKGFGNFPNKQKETGSNDPVSFSHCGTTMPCLRACAQLLTG